MDITKVPALLRDDVRAEEVMLEMYEQQDQTWRTFTDVRPVDQTNGYGKKGTVLQGAGRYKEREDGAEIEADDPGQGPSWYLKVRQYGRRLDLPYRMVEGASEGQIGDMVTEFMRSFGESAGLDKSDKIARMYERGMLTAGDLEAFDGSHPGEPDPYPKFVYDNKPWFATDHPLSGSSDTIGNYTASLTLSVTNLETVVTAFRKSMAKDERGDRIRLNPRYLIVPPELEFTARRILESVQLPGSQNNDANVIRGRLQLVVWDALTNAAGWYVSAGRGVRVYDEEPYMRLVDDPEHETWKLLTGFKNGAAVTDIRQDYAANKAAS